MKRSRQQGLMRRTEHRRLAPIGRHVFDGRTMAAQGLGQPIAATVTTNDQHARTSPILRCELLPQGFGIELRRIGRRSHGLRGRHAQTEQRARCSRPGRPSQHTGRPRRTSGSMCKKMFDSIGADEHDQTPHGEGGPRAFNRSSVGHRRHRDQRQRNGIDLLSPKPKHPVGRLRSGPRDNDPHGRARRFRERRAARPRH